MIIVTNYINELLYRYNCVIIPNFGGFITNRISAKIINNTLYPPTKQISFNSHLKHNDGLLVNYIAKAENISFEKATELVVNTVQKWQLDLNSTSIILASVGKLSKNTAQQIVFEPNTQSNFLTTSFGLTPVVTPVINRFVDKATPIIPVATTTTKTHKIPIFAKYAATAAILLTIGIVGWKGYEQNQQQKILVKQQQDLEYKIQQATFVIDNPLPTITLNVSKALPKKYHIIAGAFEFLNNAKKKVTQLKRKGFNATVIGKNKWGLTQVTFNSYQTRAEALLELKKIKKNISQDAWLLVEKLD